MELELSSVALSHGASPVLSGLSLRLEEGRIGCLLGPSGCGKTTALRCIAGFEPVGEGEIRLGGRVVSRPGLTEAPERRRIGMVFQDYALFPHLDVQGNVAFGLHGLARTERQARAREVIETVGLSDAASRYPHQLSGGQQQRVALARAIAPRPRLLLLDEPFSNLDVELRERLGTELRDLLLEYRITGLLVTHDQREAFAIADEVGVIHAGTVRQWDTPYNLYHRPADRFVADFIGEGVFLDGEVLDDGRVRVELGVLAGTLEHPISGGTMVDVLMRPDDVVYDNHSDRRALVCKRAFRGAQILYTLRLESGAHVLALVPSHHNHEVGERIGIRPDTEHLVAFAREQ